MQSSECDYDLLTLTSKVLYDKRVLDLRKQNKAMALKIQELETKLESHGCRLNDTMIMFENENEHDRWMHQIVDQLWDLFVYDMSRDIEETLRKFNIQGDCYSRYQDFHNMAQRLIDSNAILTQCKLKPEHLLKPWYSIFRTCVQQLRRKLSEYITPEVFLVEMESLFYFTFPTQLESLKLVDYNYDYNYDYFIESDNIIY